MDGSVELDDQVKLSYKYWNAKQLNINDEGNEDYFKLLPNSHFGEPVNTTTSTVHVPTSIYDQGKKTFQNLVLSESKSRNGQLFQSLLYIPNQERLQDFI